ncbi:MAG: LLM class F420-dependent oxidoreductase [Halioglobus sp.]|nr:LLM class F420-dependent oxidoreductase [Halioglobus sp.]
MKFGLIPVNVGVKSIDQMVGYSQLAESVGIESVWTFEHVIVPQDYASKYPYSADGKMGARPETNFVDPLIALTAIAANTKTLLLGTGVNIVSQANPMFLAKQAASLDFVSGGRFMLGAGIGWLQEEFDAMGVPFERRGARFDDYIIAMKKVWSGEVVEHQSEFINWSGFKSYPVPAKKSGVPIIMGGTKGKIYERVARHGDGWFLPVDNPEALAKKMAPLAAACAAEGRDPDSIEISCMWNMQGGIDAIRAFEDAGASRIIVPIFGLGKDPVAGLTEFAETIISKI